MFIGSITASACPFPSRYPEDETETAASSQQNALPENPDSMATRSLSHVSLAGSPKTSSRSGIKRKVLGSATSSPSCRMIRADHLSEALTSRASASFFLSASSSSVPAGMLRASALKIRSLETEKTAIFLDASSLESSGSSILASSRLRTRSTFSPSVVLPAFRMMYSTTFSYTPVPSFKEAASKTTAVPSSVFSISKQSFRIAAEYSAPFKSKKTGVPDAKKSFSLSRKLATDSPYTVHSSAGILTMSGVIAPGKSLLP